MSELTKEKLAELRAVAEAATAGTWRENGSLFQVAETGNGVGQVWGLNWRSDLAHVAMFDPLTVLSLIDALEAETAEVERCKRQARRAEAKLTQYERSVPALTQERDAARRERDEARANAENHVLDADATYVRMAEKLYRAKRERDESRTNADYWKQECDDARKQLKYTTQQRDDWASTADRAEDAIERVKALHTRQTAYDGNLDYCKLCIDTEGASWPCGTIRAIEGADDE